MTSQLPAAMLEDIALRSEVSPPENVRKVLSDLVAAAVPIDVSRVDGPSLRRAVSTLRDLSKESKESKDSFAALDDFLGPGLLCQAATSDGQTLLVLLDVDGSRMIAAASYARDDHEQRIHPTDLLMLLRQTGSPEAAELRQALENTSSTSPIVAHPANALTTARTFDVKYSAAMRKGYSVRGLATFVRALEALGDTKVMLAYMEPRSGSAVIMLSPQLDTVVEVLLIDSATEE